MMPDLCQARRSLPTSRLPGTYQHDAQLDYFRIADHPPSGLTKDCECYRNFSSTEDSVSGQPTYLH